MPIENERKFVLEREGELEPRLGKAIGIARHFLRQAYLDAPGVRIRSIEGQDGTRHVFTFKRTIEGQVVEIETEISAIDFDRLWTQRIEMLQKVRYSWNDGRFHWDVDFFKDEAGKTYFAMAEAEMPEQDTDPPALPPLLAPHLLIVAPVGDPRFTSKRLADRAHAAQLLADIHSRERDR